MGNKFIFLLMLLCGSLTASAWAKDTDASVAPIAAVARAPTPAPAIPQRGTLYRIRYQNHTSYLFGTIHVGQSDFFPLEPEATQAFADAGTFVLEVDTRNTGSLQNAVQKYGMYAGDNTLDQHLSAASLVKLKRALTEVGVPFDSVSHMKAWMVANLLLVLSLERQGYHSEQGTEAFLLHAAEAQHKPIQELESIDFQLSLFNNMTKKQQEQYLNENLDDLQSGIAVQQTQKLINAWANADEKAFNDLLLEAQNDQSTEGRFFIQALLNKRNPVMATKIEDLLKQNKTSFVGIGLLHLIGADGVPQLLLQHGYEVTRLY